MRTQERSGRTFLPHGQEPAASGRDTVPRIRIRGLRKQFGEKTVLDGIDLDVMPGTSMVVIGGSGSGKSVLLKCILGLLRPDSGEILVDGQPTVHLGSSERARMLTKFGMLFQGAALFDSLPVWENVAFGLIQGRGMSRRKAREVAIEKLGMVGLGPEVATLSPSELSGGMQKRVGLARAIASEPAIMFFDEPTTGLDPIMGAVIDELIVDCVKRLGSTSIAITHDMASAQRIGDDAAMLYQGRVSWTGPADELMTSTDPVVDQFTHGRSQGPIKMALRK